MGRNYKDYDILKGCKAVGMACSPVLRRIELKLNRMKTTLVTVMLMLALAASAQSIDTTTVQLSPDYLDFDEVKLQIAAQQYDSIMYGDFKEYPFGIVFLNGMGGVYDFRNAGLVTEIIYENLTYAGKKDDDDDVYHFFRWEDDETIGKMCVSESDAGVVSIGCKKEKE